LLKLFCLNLNQLVEREIALKLIWGNDSYFTGRSMDVFITKLRKYLKDDNTIEIANVHGTGYKLIIKN
jgi:DNA-binding response OmpR family regulator